MELWNEARGIPRYDVSSWGQVFERGLAEPCYTVTRVRIRETGLQPTCKGYTFERIGGEAHDS